MQTELSKTLAERTMLVDFHCSVYTGTKIDHEVTNNTLSSHKAQRDAGKFYKQLVPSALIKPVRNVSTQARSWHYDQTCAWLDDGKRILPNEQYFHYMEGIGDWQEQYFVAVSKFISNYTQIIEDNSYRLGDMHREGELPTPEAIRNKFRFDVDVYPTPVAGDFRADIAADEIERIQHNLEIMAQEAVEHSARDLWNRVYKGVAHLHDRMVAYQVDPDTGKSTNKLYDSTIGNLVDLCELLPRLNITGDADLENMRQEMMSKLTCYDTETLKNSQTLRDEVTEQTKDMLDRIMGARG